MKQCQALVEITLRLCAFCCDLARVSAESVVKWLGRIAACVKDQSENGARHCITDGIHNQRMTVIWSIIRARCWPRTLKSSRHARCWALSAPEKSAVRVACLARSHDQILMEPVIR